MWGPNLETKYNPDKSQPADQRIHQISSEYQQGNDFRQPFDLCLSPASVATCSTAHFLALGELPLGPPNRRLHPSVPGAKLVLVPTREVALIFLLPYSPGSGPLPFLQWHPSCVVSSVVFSWENPMQFHR